MLQAELRGKINENKSINDRMEDVLTSNVFGVFKYLDNKKVMEGFLNSSENVNDEPFSYITNINNWQFYFWPRLNNGREPDLLIQGFENDVLKINIVIEAKYMSGKSDCEYIENVRTGDQLADEYTGLINEGWRTEGIDNSKIVNNVLFYITNHYKNPKKDIEESIDIFEKNNSRIKFKIYWTSWRRLSIIISNNISSYSQGQREMLIDLRSLLIKKGIDYKVFDFEIDDKDIFNIGDIAILNDYTNSNLIDWDTDYVEFDGGLLYG